MANQDIFADVKERADIVDVIEDLAKIELKGGGKNKTAVCPLCGHKDCFQVQHNDQLFKCFSCGAGGSVIDFVMAQQSVDQLEAAQIIAPMVNINPDDYKRQPSGKEKKRSPKEEANEFAASYYHQALLADNNALSYQTRSKSEGGRGHKDTTISRVKLGLANGNLHRAMADAGIDDDAMISTGLVVRDEKSKRLYDYYNPGVYVYHWRNEQGLICHWTCKDPTKKRKGGYIPNEFRDKSLLWGNQSAARQMQVHLVEGEDDYLSMIDAGQGKNTLVCLGQLSDDQIGWLVSNRTDQKKGPRTFCFWFDRDPWKTDQADPKTPPGLNYTRKLTQALLRVGHANIRVASALLAVGEDPDDYIQRDITTAQNRVNQGIYQGIDPLTYELYNLPPWAFQSTNSLVHYLEQIEFWSLLSRLPDLQRDGVVNYLGQQFQISREAIMDQIKTNASLVQALEALRIDTDPKKQKEEPFFRLVARMIWDSFKQRGLFFVVDGNRCMLFFGHKLYTIDDTVEFKALMAREAGLNSTQPIYKYVKSEIEVLCFNNGERLSQFSWIHRILENDTPRLYANMQDKENRILKLADGQVSLIENGVNNEQVLLQPSSKMTPFTYNASVDKRGALSLLTTLYLNSLACAPAQRYLLLMHTLAPFFLPFSKAKALMKCEGGAGAGKTTGARLAGFLMMGRDMVGKVSTAAAYSMGSREPMLILDNLEHADLNREMVNFLLLVATGATREKRAQGTDSATVSEELNTILWVTAIEPFSKPELINRTYIVNFERKYRSAGISMEDIQEQLLSRRDDILSAVLQLFAEDVLPTLQTRRREWLRTIQHTFPDHSKARMDEYLALLACVLEKLLPYLPETKGFNYSGAESATAYLLREWVGYQNELAFETEANTNEVANAFERLRETLQSRFAGTAQAVMEDDEITIYGITATRVPDVMSGAAAGRENPFQRYQFMASSRQLLAAFQMQAKELGIRCPFQNAQQLAARVREQLPNLAKLGWHCDTSKSGVKIRKGTKYFPWSWTDAEETIA